MPRRPLLLLPVLLATLACSDRDAPRPVPVPGATPDTRPLALTVAIAVFELAHVIVRPESVLPPASLSVATSCSVVPTVTNAGAGEIVTDATGTC